MPGSFAPITDLERNRLMDAARRAASDAYAPYSRFPVGAAVLTEDGTIVTGFNIENASYGLTVCGERVATFTAIGAGHRTIRAVAISTPRSPGATPCGACRQVLNEFKPQRGNLVIFTDGKHGIEETTLDDLLPHAFGPRDIE